MPSTPATRQDVENLRNDLRDHEQRDREDFASMNERVEEINTRLVSFLGGFGFAKWSIGLCLPAILVALIGLYMKR
jgi:hypothetical protein